MKDGVECKNQTGKTETAVNFVKTETEVIFPAARRTLLINILSYPVSHSTSK